MESITEISPLLRQVMKFPKVRAVMGYIEHDEIMISVKSKWRWRKYKFDDIGSLMDTLAIDYK